MIEEDSKEKVWDTAVGRAIFQISIRLVKIPQGERARTRALTFSVSGMGKPLDEATTWARSWAARKARIDWPDLYGISSLSMFLDRSDGDSVLCMPSRVVSI
jgi:hypothetical protein